MVRTIYLAALLVLLAAADVSAATIVIDDGQPHVFDGGTLTLDDTIIVLDGQAWLINETIGRLEVHSSAEGSLFQDSFAREVIYSSMEEGHGADRGIAHLEIHNGAFRPNGPVDNLLISGKSRLSVDNSVGNFVAESGSDVFIGGDWRMMSTSGDFEDDTAVLHGLVKESQPNALQPVSIPLSADSSWYIYFKQWHAGDIDHSNGDNWGIGVGDLNMVRNCFGCTSGFRHDADYDGDFDIDDLNMVRNNFGAALEVSWTPPTSAAVPEPTSAALLLLGLATYWMPYLIIR